jgi:hypothetical protein
MSGGGGGGSRPSPPSCSVSAPRSTTTTTSAGVDGAEQDDIIWEFVHVPDSVAQDEAQLIRAMVGGGYWERPHHREGSLDFEAERELLARQGITDLNEMIDSEDDQPNSDDDEDDGLNELTAGGLQQQHQRRPSGYDDPPSLNDSEMEWMEEQIGKVADDPDFFF